MLAKPTVSGVNVYPAGTPGFQAAVQRLGATATVNQLGAALDYFVALEFTDPNIKSFRILFELTDGKRTVRRANLSSYINVRAGDVLLAAPAPLDRVAAAINHQPMKPLPSQPDIGFLTGRTGTASIDSVTLSDGSFLGPDVLVLYDRLSRRGPAIVAFLSELSGRLASADLQSWLTAAAQKPLQPGSGIGSADLVGAAVRTCAARALTILTEQGPAALSTWVSQEVAHNQNTTPMRRVQ